VTILSQLSYLAKKKGLKLYQSFTRQMSLFVEKENAVIVGDAMVIENGMLSLANPRFTIDVEKAKISMKQLLNMRAKTYYCYHGAF
jgi:glyoxylase-like metal-dependent hydrolase (beta-lactamase superfamily II)